jgi:hypothetical protein
MSLLDHQELMICQGVGIVPGDTNTSEQPLVILNLYDSSTGISVAEWTPNIPSLKSGGVWADSPISDGRTLVSGVNTNVTETMEVVLTGGNLQDYAAKFANLQRMIQASREFWDTTYQMQPVYLRWWANGAPGPQFALIYNIDLDVQWEDSLPPQANITMTIEREFGWRGIAPGSNPKQWTVENYLPGLTWDTSHADLLSGSDHIINDLLENRMEWNSTQTALLSSNYTDIPALAVPGDLPALIEMDIRMASGAVAPNRVFVGKTAKPDLLTAPGVARRPNYILNSGDGGVGTDTSIGADTGGPIRSSSGVNSRGACTFATLTTDAARLSWSPSSVGTYFDFSTLRGRYMAFVRARLSAASTVALHLRVTTDQAQTLDYPTINLTNVGSGGTGNTTSWGVSYLGVVTFPINDQRVIVGSDGLGISVPTSGASPILSLFAARVGGAVTLYVSDIILIPMDDGAFVYTAPGTVANNSGFQYDNTGYFLHGNIGDYYAAETGGGTFASEGRGGLTLTPNTINRLVFFLDNPGAGTILSGIDSTFRVRANIVPRWSAIRTV